MSFAGQGSSQISCSAHGNSQPVSLDDDCEHKPGLLPSNTSDKKGEISKHASIIQEAPIVCMDGNIPTESIEFISGLCADKDVPCNYVYSPEEVHGLKTRALNDAKLVEKLLRDRRMLRMRAFRANKKLERLMRAIELEQKMHKETRQTLRAITQDDQSFTDKLRECLQLSRVLLRHVYCLFITLGEEGILVCRNAEPEQRFVISNQGLKDIEIDGMFSAVHYPVSSDIGSITSVSGAGDCLAAASIANMLRGHDPDFCLGSGLLAAQRSLQSHHAVPSSINKELISPDFVLSHMTLDPSRLQ
eukprot:XP_011675270.1 PREDICTED: uncharacterized protein LOC105443611 [Strongylocentrotus purpuratus]